ncbi:MAG: hypothetical protein D6730_15640 [Bacteroidetes bacterium]|nr:MAG: hypothetical protein D6730_15640 [Bacteroidota bacterium]
MLELLMDMLVLGVATASVVVAVMIIRRHPDVIEMELFSTEPQLNALPAHPQLEFERIFQRERNGSSCLQILLKNTGQSLFYQGFKVGKKSELNVQYLPQDSQQGQEKAAADGRGDEYPTGTSLTFFLCGPVLQDSYYDILLHYTDRHGNAFLQRVSGLGHRPPVVDPPRSQGTISLSA